MKKQSITLIMIFLSLLMNACTDNKSIREADLEGYTWVLTDLSGGLLLEGHQPTLKFDGGQISGDAECDHYGGSYHLGGDTIRVEGLFNTEMACPEPEGIMAQEQIYLDMLRTT
jgi:heat shock protein HslJ